MSATEEGRPEEVGHPLDQEALTASRRLRERADQLCVELRQARGELERDRLERSHAGASRLRRFLENVADKPDT